MRTAQKLRKLIADRFEPNDHGFVYRPCEGAEGIAVGADERRRFLADFDRHIVWLRWPCKPWIGGAAAFGLAFVAYRLSNSPLVTPLVFWAALLAPGVIAAWLAAAPGRALKHRPRLDAGLSVSERRRRRLAALTWSGVLWDTLIAAVVLYSLFHKPLGPSERIVLITIAVGTLAATLGVVGAKARMGRLLAGASLTGRAGQTAKGPDNAGPPQRS